MGMGMRRVLLQANCAHILCKLGSAFADDSSAQLASGQDAGSATWCIDGANAAAVLARINSCVM
jgi:hypothetical protein